MVDNAFDDEWKLEVEEKVLEYSKQNLTRSSHQLKMAAPAEVSEKRSNFRIIQF